MSRNDKTVSPNDKYLSRNDNFNWMVFCYAFRRVFCIPPEDYMKKVVIRSWRWGRCSFKSVGLAALLALGGCGGGDGGTIEPISGVPPPSQPSQFTMSGSLSGLRDGRSLVVAVQAPGMAAPMDVLLVANGEATLHTGASGEYSLQVVRQPDGQICTANPASGILAAGAPPIHIVCNDLQYRLGGTVVGLTNGVSLTLYNTNQDGTIVDSLSMQSSGRFEFPRGQVQGQFYNVTLAFNAGLLMCSVQRGSGTARGDVLDVEVLCSAAEPPPPPPDDDCTEGNCG